MRCVRQPHRAGLDGLGDLRQRDELQGFGQHPAGGQLVDLQRARHLAHRELGPARRAACA